VGQTDRERMIEFIETVLLYKFAQMSREEVEAMFTLGDLEAWLKSKKVKSKGKNIWSSQQQNPIA
jgi:predicted transposase YdaD